MIKIPSSHGSLTIAVKVKEQPPVVESNGVNSRKKSLSIRRFRELYRERVIDDRYAGQPDSIGTKRSSYKL